MRLAIAEIEAAVAGLRGDADEARRLVEGYRHVDRLLAERVEIFAYGQSRHLLELNHRVLCGVTPERRLLHAAHLAETERRFYEAPGGGFGALHAWIQRHRGRPPRQLAAGAFLQVVSTPQLFIEGNCRTAALLASWLLARSGLPPLVVTAAAHPRFAAICERAVAVDRSGFTSAIALTLAGHRMADFLADTADPRFLRAPAPAEG